MRKYNTILLLVIFVVLVAATRLVWDFKNQRCTIQLGLDLRSGSHISLQLLDGNFLTGKPMKVTKTIQEQAVLVFQKRLNPDGTKEIVITPEQTDRLIIEIPEMTNLAEAEALVRKAGRLEIREQFYDPPTGTVRWKAVFDGSKINHAFIAPDEADSWSVIFEMTPDGITLFSEISQRLLGRQIGFFFDNQLISAATLETAVPGAASCQIRGLKGGRPHPVSGQPMTGAQEANELATFLNAGALPVDVKLLESYTVSPTLGAESLRYSLVSGLIGLSAVCVYMAFYYRIPGCAAGAALVVYTILTLASMNIPGLQFVLTLPGIAGFVLSIGMAVDANVLIFERLKEELWSGKTVQQSIKIAFERAWSSILDGHVTTALGAFILYYFGSNSIKGFGLTLLIGTAWSLITATLVTRCFLHFCIDKLGLAKPNQYGG
jgi:preprotein translocase subunit SecD